MKVVSLFSGSGGLDLGFKMAGHNIREPLKITNSTVLSILMSNFLVSDDGFVCGAGSVAHSPLFRIPVRGGKAAAACGSPIASCQESVTSKIIG